MSEGAFHVFFQAPTQQPPRDEQRVGAGATIPDCARGSLRGSVLRARRPLAAGEHLVQHAPERPYVNVFAARLSARLFGTHIGGRARDLADSGHERRHGRGAVSARRRRVCRARPNRDLDDAVGVSRYLRLEVPVHQALSCAASSAPGCARRSSARPAAQPLAREDRAERLARHVFHDDGAARFRFAELVHGGDVRCVTQPALVLRGAGVHGCQGARRARGRRS